MRRVQAVKTHSLCPVLGALFCLSGIGVECLVRPRPAYAEPYHRRIREAAARFPGDIGAWHGSDEPIPRAAVALLRPNAAVHRLYVHRTSGRSLVFLLVACRDARDMVGHHPPVCYAGKGWTPLSARRVTWAVAGREMWGTEYEFSRMDGGRVRGLFVSSLVLLPGGTCVHGAEEIGAIASDYLRQFHGAAQVQFVFESSCPESMRRQAVQEILTAGDDLLNALRAGPTL